MGLSQGCFLEVEKERHEEGEQEEGANKEQSPLPTFLTPFRGIRCNATRFDWLFAIYLLAQSSEEQAETRKAAVR